MHIISTEVVMRGRIMYEFKHAYRLDVTKKYIKDKYDDEIWYTKDNKTIPIEEISKEVGVSLDYFLGYFSSYNKHAYYSSDGIYNQAAINCVKHKNKTWQGFSREKFLEVRSVISNFRDQEDFFTLYENISNRLAISKFRNAIKNLTEKYNMPNVPGPKITLAAFKRKMVLKKAKVPVIYFLWLNGICVYVGQSTNGGSRISGYANAFGDNFVSLITCEKEKLLNWEKFYIWLLDPVRNNQ